MGETTYLQPKFVGTADKVLRFNPSGGLDAVDPPAASIKPLLKVAGTTGSTVTIAYNGATYTPTEQSGTGIWYQELPYTGYTATLTATNGSATVTETANITVSKMYNVELTLPLSNILNDNTW